MYPNYGFIFVQQFVKLESLAYRHVYSQVTCRLLAVLQISFDFGSWTHSFGDGLMKMGLLNQPGM